MTCIKAQSLITPFINDKLNNIKELEEFLEHIRSCDSCRDELEVYYTILTAMNQLDEDKNLSDDFSLELYEKLDKAQDRIVHYKLAHYRKRGILLCILVLLAVFISLQHSMVEREKENPVTKSNFAMRTVFDDERYQPYKVALKYYLSLPKATPTPVASGSYPEPGTY